MKSCREGGTASKSTAEGERDCRQEGNRLNEIAEQQHPDQIQHRVCSGLNRCY